MSAPPIAERHLHHFHRRSPIKETVRVATTANITISTALNNGDTLDGITLATDDRVLVKNQTAGAENGIYIVGASPARSYDVSTDDPAFGYLVLVLQGTVGAGTLWQNTNTTAPTIGSTALTFSQFSGGGMTDPMTTRGDIIYRNSSNVTARLGVGGASTVLSSDGTDVSWQAAGSGGTITTKDEGSTLSSTVTTLDFVGAGVTASGSGATTTVTIPGGGSSTWPPLDQYTIDGTYGDHFTGGSLSGSWTRRNFTSGAETYAKGYNSTYIRIVFNGRAVGDGYFRTAPAGDWTIAMKAIFRTTGPSVNDSNFGLAVVDTNGTGVGFLPSYSAHTPWAPLLVGITTYSTYGGTYYEPYRLGTTSGPNLNILNTEPFDRPIWNYLRKSGTNYYAAYSFDGEIWSVEAGPIAWAGTVDRFGMLLLAPGGPSLTNMIAEVDWFNKIA